MGLDLGNGRCLIIRSLGTGSLDHVSPPALTGPELNVVFYLAPVSEFTLCENVYVDTLKCLL